MAAFLSNLRNVVIAGFILAIGVLAIRLSKGGLDLSSVSFWAFIIRWLHIICGVMWIGLCGISTLSPRRRCRKFPTT